jgi:hypothetical protein
LARNLFTEIPAEAVSPVNLYLTRFLAIIVADFIFILSSVIISFISEEVHQDLNILRMENKR